MLNLVERYALKLMRSMQPEAQRKMIEKMEEKVVEFPAKYEEPKKSEEVGSYNFDETWSLIINMRGKGAEAWSRWSRFKPS